MVEILLYILCVLFLLLLATPWGVRVRGIKWFACDDAACVCGAPI